MRERIKRRKPGATPEKANAPAPLQPNFYGDIAETPEPEPEPAVAEPVVEAQPQSQPEADSEAKPGDARRGPLRRRRRRGGRGGGRRGSGAAASPEAAAAPAQAASAVPEGGASEAAAVAEDAVESAQPAPLRAAARPSKGTVVLAIGLPGSGKSTWFKRHEIRPLSSDMMRNLLFDDVREQKFQDLVFSNLRSMLKARLIARRPMNYVDATNLTPQERQHWIKLAKDFGYEVQAVFFDVPLEVCIERHQRRDRIVPEDIMRKMASKLKAPTFEEGFSKITVVRVKKKENQAVE